MQPCNTRRRRLHRPRRAGRIAPVGAGFSLLEIIAVTSILAILAAVAIQRFSSSGPALKRNTCYTLKRNIEVQAQLYRRNTGTWPTNLGQIAGDTAYFPDGVPKCPVDGTAYELDATTHQVIGHNH